MNENNVVEIIGQVVTSINFNHECKGEKFFSFLVESIRTRGVKDIIPVIASEKILKNFYENERVRLQGEFRSRNIHEEGGKKHIELFVFATKITIEKEDDKVNSIFLNGFICKKPTYRTTPNGREISDILLAVNRQYKKSDYIPCIVWGRNARYISQFPVGTEVKLEGRIQSREYLKKLDDGTRETKTAYEVSVGRIYEISLSRIDVAEESEGNKE